jgi:hypothetical protein
MLARLASKRSKPLDLDACPTPSSSSIGFVEQPTNHSSHGFEAQTKKPSRWFWGHNHQIVPAGFEAQTGKPVATDFDAKPRNRTLCPPTSRSSGHQVPNLCLTIPDPLHQVSFSCDNPCHCQPSRTCHLHTTRQANTILYTNRIIRVEPLKSPGFKFKLRQVNYSSKSNQDTDHLVSQSPPWWVHWQHKSTKFQFWIQDTWSTARRPKAKEKLKKVI